MELPLYNGISLPTNLAQANKSLIFDKFYEWYRLGGELKEQNKIDNLKRLISGGCGDRKAIDRYIETVVELVESLDGKWSIFKNEWHFITGMGNDHPLENGMAWHHTLGTPYLAGSGVKGLIRAYCEEWAQWDREKIDRCFGKAADKKSEGSAGDYIFFDAFPTGKPTLTVDVMTPHMGKWYEQGGENKHNFENTPGDWHTPIPITFLVVKDISLLFAIAKRPGKGNNEELNELMDALDKALEWIGSGAKTAAGYGRFSKDISETARLQEIFEEQKKKMSEEENAKNLSPLERKFAQLKAKTPGAKIATIILNGLQNGEFVNFDRSEVLKELKKKMQEANEWKESTGAKNPNKDKNYQKTLKVLALFKECS